LFFSLARTELKGTATSFSPMSRKPPDANNQGRDTAFLVNQHVIDVVDLVVRRVVNILLVEVGHGGPGRQPGEDLRRPGGGWGPLLG
jgi:hypothetical protein